MIFCCGAYHVVDDKNGIDRKIKLFDNEHYENRYLEVIKCPKCNKVKALMTQRCIIDGKLCEKKPKKGKLKEFINYYEHEPYEEIKIKTPKTGSASNMYWYYINGIEDNIIRDLNDTEFFEFESKIKIIKNYCPIC